MTVDRLQTIEQLREFFSVSELVCPHTYKRWGEQSWQFLSTDYLRCLLAIRRDILQAPMTCNNGSTLTQRGLRCNRCDLVRSKKNPYLSAHVLGMAGDFTVSGMTAEQARQRIKTYAYLLPCPIRIEGGVSWLHFDTLPQHNIHINQQVYEFTE